nr:MAG TPA: hyaluronidase [Bacteriophage sp.]
MATKTLKSRIKNKRDTSANWTKNDPVLLDGEIIIVDTDAGETRYKIGDGTKKYSQLPFQDEAVRNLINGKLDKTATAADSSKLNGQDASYYAVDSDVVHKAGTETITGNKTFSGTVSAQTPASNANNTLVATTAFVKTALSSVGGVDISLNANQPSGQSSGDFWYQITTA